MNKFLCVTALLLFSLPTRAELLDPLHSPNGGQMRMAGAYRFELVVARDSPTAKENPVTVFLTDHAGQKLPAAGTQAKLTLLDGKRKVEISLLPGDENKLLGQGIYAATPNLKAIVAVTFADGHSEQARFTPLLQTAARPLESDAHSGHRH